MAGIPNIPIHSSLLLQISKAGSNAFNLVPGEILSLDILEILPDNRYLMNLKGATVNVKSETALNPGQTLEVKVQSVHPQLVLKAMDVLAQTGVLETGSSGAQKGFRHGALLQVLSAPSESQANSKLSDRPLPQLASGQTLMVRVLEQLPGHKYVLDLKGAPVTVSSEAPFIAGDKLSVRVLSVQPQLILKVVESQEQSAASKTFENQGQKGIYPPVQNQQASKALSLFDALKTSGRMAPDLSPGQILTVAVQEKIPGNRYLVAVKDVFITATSEVPLKEGDRLQVKVQSVSPQIVLNAILPQKQTIEAKIHEKLIQWRINPEALTQIYNRIDEFALDLKSAVPLTGFSSKDADGLLRILEQIVLSPKTRWNPLFLKDFIAQTGLMMEKDLALMASHKPLESNSGLVENLKAMLLKLSDSINRTLPDTAKFDSSAIGKIQNLASFAADVLKHVENGQAVNVVYQQNDDGLYLQIPLALGQSYRHADIFIHSEDRNAPASRKYASCSVNIFLNLDYLGEIAIDVALKDGRIRCIIKCENEATKELLDASSPDLQDALTKIGYGVGRIECIKSSDLAEIKAEFIGRHIQGTFDLVNSYA